MDIGNEDLSPAELEIKEKIETGYGKWPEIAGAILTATIILVLFIFSDGSY